MSSEPRQPRNPGDSHSSRPSLKLNGSLAEVPLGSTAQVVAVEAPEPVRSRLADLGFLPGTRVTYLRRAPLGDPGVYELRGTQLCLRRTEARAIRVRAGV